MQRAVLLFPSCMIKGRGRNLPTLSLNVCTNLLARSKCHGRLPSQNIPCFSLWSKFTFMVEGLRYFEIVSLNGSVLNKTSCCKFRLHYNLDFFFYRINFYPIIWGKVKNLQWGNPDHVDLDVPDDGVTWSDELSYVFVLSTKEGSPWHGRFAAIAFHV